MTAELGSALTLLAWDSEFFGKRIARVSGHDLSLNELSELTKLALRQGIDCLYYLVDPMSASASHAAERVGFGLVDVRLTLEGPVPADAEAVPGVRLAGPQDIDRLCQIARSSHGDARFYFDANFPREKCDELYAAWIRNSVLQGFSDAVLVVDGGPDVMGYVTCQRLASGVGSIGLFAVAPEARGSGRGQRLVSAALRWFAERKVERARVVTQARNVPAQRLYQQRGLLTSDVKLWYHLWPAAH